MRKSIFQRFLSLVLVCALTLSLVPSTAFAGLLDNSPEYNQEILDQITAIFDGDEQSAQAYYDVM